ncbi:MAG: hypothetical protein KKF41_07920 [Actinobacteria bacterium]|nr:hypothetical protein [Actinomycetota bacterium]MBU1944178.1 hypothetical protein [Actinomycetota bacterium]MBU2687497.1 hypothetical protein [Actinomycetota bacterium]
MTGIPYLTQEWLDESKSVLNSSELVKAAGRGTFTGSFQHFVTDLPACCPPESAAFYSRFADGRCEEVWLGAIDGADVTFTGPYSAWKRIHSGQASIVTSVFTFKVKVRVNPLKALYLALRYRGMFKMSREIATMPTEYSD